MYRHKKVCKTCKSDNIRFDAWAEWSSQMEQFILSNEFRKI